MAEFPKTHWIWIPGVEETVRDEARIVYFRREFEAEKGHTRKIRISADTRYKLYINGQFAQFGPARGDQRIWYYDEVDLTPFLRDGRNVIAVEVLRYAVAYGSGNFGMFRTATPGLYVEEPGGSLTADETWKCRERKNYRILREAEGFSPLMYLEECGGDAEVKNWKLPEFDDSGWKTAFAYNVLELKPASCPADLHRRPIPFLKLEKRRLAGVVPKYDAETADKWEQFLNGGRSVEIPAGTRTEVELNAGELTCGYLSLRMQRGAGACVKMLLSEGYVQDGKSMNGVGLLKGDRLDWVNGHLHGHTDVYHADGYGTEDCEEVYEQYWFRTFRFIRLEIETAEEPLVLTGFDYLETGYPLEAKASVETSDETMTGIWEISLRSLKRCMQETYVDCPFYEQLQYAMDSRSEILYTYMVSGDDRLARQCMDDFRRSQREDGMINCCHPNYGPNVIPGFAIYYILMVYDHMMFFGDQKLVRKHLPCIDGILGYFDEHLDERGLVGKTGGHISERYWSFVDWAIPWGKSVGMPPAGYCGPLTMESLLYIMGLQHAAKLCEYVGRESTAKEYRRRAELVQEAVNAHCRDSEGVYLDGPGVQEYSQHCQMFAVLTETAEEREWKRLLRDTLEDTEKYAQYTVSTAFYLFRALEKAGMYERTEKLWDLWREMLGKHLTTCVENATDERSDCHAWGAVILYELTAVTLGVGPAEPGFERIRIAPVPGYLDWAKGTAATKWGMVSVEWKKREDGSLEVEYEVPEGMEDKVEVGG
ncbi:MAG: alpha-L-rhamnosidase C-terminal domain-containing protein [Eubacteriales bacterium]|nr:alpha-L-rhamnosidase C-terminal domain-containing protein [Eubacteriales bacterium]